MYRQKLSWLSLFAIALSYGGTVIVMLQEQSNTPHDTYFWLGSSLVFASAVCFAGYLLLTKSLIQHFGSWNFTGLALSIACIGTLYALQFGRTESTGTGATTACRSARLWYCFRDICHSLAHLTHGAQYRPFRCGTIGHDCFNWPHLDDSIGHSIFR